MNAMTQVAESVSPAVGDATVTAPPKPVARPRNRSKASPATDVAELRRWLDRLGLAARPTVHVNGPAFANVVLVVDFGTPLGQGRLSTEQSAELADHIRRACRAIVGGAANVRVANDHHAGIWWASLG